MLNYALSSVIQAPVLNPVLTNNSLLKLPNLGNLANALVNPNRSPSIGLPKVGFYPATHPLGLFKTVEITSNRALTPDFISMMNAVKIRRDILKILDCACHSGIFFSLILSIIQVGYTNTNPNEIRRELDYLAKRDLIKIESMSNGRLFCELRRFYL